MGVNGLWSVIEPTGRVVALETLNNQILGVDISIWLNQAIKGFRDPITGNALPNAHLLGLFYRICKLLFYGIKPIFVFDGRAPELKRATLDRRRKRKEKNKQKLSKGRLELLENAVRTRQLALKADKTALLAPHKNYETRELAKLLRQKTRNNKDDHHPAAAGPEQDIFKLPPMKREKGNDDYSSSDDDISDPFTSKGGTCYSDLIDDIHDLDVESAEFKYLPKETQYEVLLDLKERRKQNSWAKLDSMPAKADEFSSFQLDRLRKRSQLQKTMDNVGTELNSANLFKLDPQYFVGDKKGLKNQRKIQQLLEQDIEEQDIEEQEAIHLTSYQFDDSEPGTSKSNQIREEIPSTPHDPPESLPSSSSTSIPIPKIISKAPILSDDSSSNTDDESFIEVDPSMNEKPSNDLFADIFDNAESVSKLDSILTESKKRKSLSPSQKKSSGSKKSKIIHHPTETNNTPKDSTEKSESILLQNNGESNTKMLMEKMGSIKSNFIERKVTAAVSALNQKSSESMKKDKKSDSSSDDEVATMDSKESDNLIQRMKISQKENRLLKFTTMNYDESNEIQKSKLTLSTQESEEKTEEKILENKVDKVVDKEDYTKQVINHVYGDSAEGFIRSSKLGPVIEVDSNDQINKETVQIDDKILQKLGNEDATTDEDILTTEELLSLQNSLAKEREILVAQTEKIERTGNTVTDEMIADCQELLLIFGIPWVVSPSEAEAQCAQLEILGLTNGTITDDSDAWVFGSKKVYKNFFNAEKHVTVYNMSEIHGKTGLDREKFISFAMLTGSDYTDGIENVGPITALEIISEFTNDNSGFEVLSFFKTWWSETKNKGVPENNVRKHLKRLDLSEDFPNKTIYDGYLNPVVDSSKEKFSWAIPNFVLIRDFVISKLGWDKKKVDDMLKPVIKTYNNKITQSRIDNYFSRVASTITQPEMTSKRGLSAIQKVVSKKNQNNDHPDPEHNKNKDQILKTKAEEAKLKAIEIYKKSKQREKTVKARGGVKIKRAIGKILIEANLSSDSD